MTFNDTHPELEKGEIFLCNTANPTASQYDWKTKRVGKVAYNIHGEKAKGLYPVFRQKDDEC